MLNALCASMSYLLLQSLSPTLLSHLCLRPFCHPRTRCLRLRLQPRRQKNNILAKVLAMGAAQELDSPKSFRLFMNSTCAGDSQGPAFPKESLYSQREHLTCDAARHPTRGFVLQAFLVHWSMHVPFEPATAVAAAVTTAQPQNQAARHHLYAPPRVEGADDDRFPIAVYL